MTYTVSRTERGELCPYCLDRHLNVATCPFRDLMEPVASPATSPVSYELVRPTPWDFLESAEPVALADTDPDECRWMPLSVTQVWPGDQA